MGGRLLCGGGAPEIEHVHDLVVRGRGRQVEQHGTKVPPRSLIAGHEDFCPKVRSSSPQAPGHYSDIVIESWGNADLVSRKGN